MFKLRFDADDRARLDRIAAHYASSHAGAIRMLMKREDDAITAQLATTPNRRPKRSSHRPSA